MHGLSLTLRHYYDFGRDRPLVGSDLTNPESWDILRTKTSGAFSLPATREEFVRAATQQADIAARASAIDEWLDKQGANAVASYGVGGAALEWCMYQLRPDRELIITDYGEATVERLAEVFPEAQVRYHDLLRDGPLAADAHLFHRIDTEFSNQELLGVLRRFGSASILVVVARVLDTRGLLREVLNRPRLKLRGASRAGFIRTSAAFDALWRPTHLAQRIRVNDLDAWSLVPRAQRSQDQTAASPAEM